MNNHVEITEWYKNLTIVDAHCDTLTAMSIQERRLGMKSEKGHLDLPRLIKAGVNIQFFAVYVPAQYRHLATVKALEVIDLFFQEMEDNYEIIEPIFNYSDVQRITSLKKIGALLTIEGGEALSGRIECLRMFYRLGVRSITLTWNNRNELADGIGERHSGGGLTKFGIAVIKEMDKLGMIVDVSHLSESGFWDVIDLSKKPVIASHSNCRSICDHPRNLSDEQIKAIAMTGGVIGLCFYPTIICSNKPSLERLLDHAVHMAFLVGVEHIGLGSDFDGIKNVAPGLEDVTCLPDLAEGLYRRGFSKSEISMILGGNFLRVMKQTLKY